MRGGFFGLLAMLLIAACVGLSGRAIRAEPLFPVERFTLANGMQVVVLPNHRAPVVVHIVWYKVGAADDPPGKSGVAHFLEHLMFKGTPAHPDGVFSRIVAENGGVENAFTTSDYTAYFQKIAKDRLELVMALEADRMRNLLLTDEVVQLERNVILEERSMRIDNEPAALLAEQADAVLYLHHPYGTPTIGWRHEMEILDRTTVLDFYRRHYAPNNAILVVAGDVTAAELKPLAEKYYGVIPAVSHEATPRNKEPPPSAARRVTMVDARAAQPSLMRSYLAPAAPSGDRTMTTALSVLSEILGGKTTSRLYRSLTVEQKVAAYAGSTYHALSRDDTSFQLFAAPLAGTSIGALEKALDSVVSEIIAKGVTETELKDAVERMQAQVLYALDDPQAIAHLFGSVLAVGLSIDDIETWPEQLAAVTLGQVNAAARATLKPERSVTAILLPKAEG
jgi:zinc protease